MCCQHLIFVYICGWISNDLKDSDIFFHHLDFGFVEGFYSEPTSLEYKISIDNGWFVQEMKYTNAHLT